MLEQPLDQGLFVVGPPGSGKTSLALRRAQMCARSRRSCCVVTFNRMLRRLLHLLDRQSRRDGSDTRPEVIVRTMDSFVGEDWRKRFPDDDLPDYPSRLHDWDARLERLAGSLTDESGWSHIVVDEGQDLPVWFFRYASIICGAVTVFADEEQAIRSDVSGLKEIKQAAGLPDPRILTENHRNTPEIARVAEHFHDGRLPAARVVRGSGGEVPRLLRLPDTRAVAAWVSRWFANRGGTVGVIAEQNVAVEALRNAIGERLPSVTVKSYTHSSANEGEIDVTKPGVTVLNVNSAKGQEFDAVFVTELERFLPCESAQERRRLYMMCTRGRSHLFLVQHQSHPLREVDHALPAPEMLRLP